MRCSRIYLLSFCQSTSQPTAASSLPSRSKATPTSTTSPSGARKTSRTTSASPTKKGKKRPADTKHHETSSKSLHSFFQPATEEQRWASRKSGTKSSPEQALDEIEDKEDLIEDDYSSCEEIFADQLAKETRAGNDGNASSQGPRKQASRSSSQSDHTNKFSRPKKRFLLPASPNIQGPREHGDVGAKSWEADGRPWPERYAPSNLDELAVHKKKVADVRNWLADVFAGKNRRVCVSSLNLIRKPGCVATSQVGSNLPGYRECLSCMVRQAVVRQQLYCCCRRP